MYESNNSHTFELPIEVQQKNELGPYKNGDHELCWKRSNDRHYVKAKILSYYVIMLTIIVNTVIIFVQNFLLKTPKISSFT